MDKKKNNKKTIIMALIIIVFLIIIAILIIIWSKSDVTSFSSDTYENMIKDEVRWYASGPSDPHKTPLVKGKALSGLSVQASIRSNTAYVSGVMDLSSNKTNPWEDSSPLQLSYSATFSVGEWNSFKVKSLGDIYITSTKEQPLDLTTSLFGFLGKKAPTWSVWKGTTPFVSGGGVVTSDAEYIPLWQSILARYVPTIVILGLLIFGIYYLYKMQAGGMSGGLNPFNMGKNNAKKVESKVRFTDIAGISDEKNEFIELVDYLKNPKKYSTAGARAPKGVLLVGPPGTGKTLMAKAVAGEAGVPFYSISGSEFEEVFVGVGASRIRNMFNQAKKNSPCIIFIDEIDAVGRRRSTSSMGSSTSEQTLNQLLVELDGFGTNSGVLVIAATNLEEVLDKALLRPGRIDRQIQLSLPNIKERAKILKLHARNKKISSAIDFYRIAQRTPGFSGAQLENVLNEAAILCVRLNRKSITLDLIDEAVDRVIGGPAKKDNKYTVTDKDTVSYHESGHALIGMKLKHASNVHKVTIIPRGQSGGYTIMAPEEETMFQSKEQLIATIIGFLGGRAAEEIKFGKMKITTGAHDDFEKATNIARHMVTEFGMSSLGMIQYESKASRERNMGMVGKWYSEEVASKIDNEIKKIIDSSYIEAKKVISGNLEELELISESLRVLEVLTAEQIEYIDKHMKLPKEVIKEKEYVKTKEEKIKKEEIIELSPEKDKVKVD